MQKRKRSEGKASQSEPVQDSLSLGLLAIGLWQGKRHVEYMHSYKRSTHAAEINQPVLVILQQSCSNQVMADATGTARTTSNSPPIAAVPAAAVAMAMQYQLQCQQYGDCAHYWQ